MFKLKLVPLGYTTKHITKLCVWMEIRVLPSFVSSLGQLRERVTCALYLIRPLFSSFSFRFRPYLPSYESQMVANAIIRTKKRMLRALRVSCATAGCVEMHERTTSRFKTLLQMRLSSEAFLQITWMDFGLFIKISCL
ncbi:unnamed protein product [Lasius platythorax]|uniref:Uncharacterized protein n=1 Tax=Lasius platythorax TaxID=488582 RepID=A0AAV2NW74_9HYME